MGNKKSITDDWYMHSISVYVPCSAHWCHIRVQVDARSEGFCLTRTVTDFRLGVTVTSKI